MKIGVGFHQPAVSIGVGVNDGSVWFPVDLNGKPVSPTNTLPPGENITQTFSWTQIAGRSSYRSIVWVGECAEENGFTSITING